MHPTLILSPENMVRSVEKAHAVLSSGGLVAFPTETVYCLAARMNDTDAVDRIYDLKGRDQANPLAIYVPHGGPVEAHVSVIQRDARVLMALAWPGPLTLVMETGGGETVGFRCPDHPFPLLLSEKCDFPIVGTSANLTGESPISRAVDISEILGQKVDLVISDDDAGGGQASTVLLVPESGPLQMLREGGISMDQIRKHLCKRTVFVCTGNTCRSPMAEAMAQNSQAQNENATDQQFLSAGISALEGEPVSENAILAMGERDIDISDHTATPIDRFILESSDTIYTMTGQHREIILELHPQMADRVFALGGDHDIPDPIGGDLKDYRKCAAEIDDCLSRVLENR